MAATEERPGIGVDPASGVSVDPVTFEVIRHRLLGITDEQAAKLRAISGSRNVTEMSDFNVGLYLPDGSVATMGRTILFHSYSMATMVRYVMEDCFENPGIGPGDMFIVNNPWKGALHAPDMCIVAPVFADGELIFWSGALMHMQDIGGLAPGGMGLNATESYQEGLQLPPVKLVEGGVLRRDLWNMILSHSRAAPAMTLDLKGLMAANHAATVGFEKLVQRYGVEMLRGVMAGLVRLSEARMRRRLRELPDATIESVGYLAYDRSIGAVPEVVLKLTKRGDTLTFDYSDSSPQVPNSTNCTWGGLMAGICAGLLPTIAYDIPWNTGLYNPIEVICPEGRICNARKPGAVSGNISGAVWEVEQTATEALSKLAACSDQYLREAQAAPAGRPGGGAGVAFRGVNHHGEPFRGGMGAGSLASGAGAYSDHDGISPQGHHNIERVITSNIEALELETPVLYLWYGLAPDGGGAGRYRGGNSPGSVYKPHRTTRLEAGLTHQSDVPDSNGLFGGHLGSVPMRVWIHDSNVEALMADGRVPTFEELQGAVFATPGAEAALRTGPEGMVEVTPSDVFRSELGAGAGWGDPLDRPPEEVQVDLDFGAITPTAAQQLYGAALDSQGNVDVSATQARRAGIRAERMDWPVRRQLTSGPSGPVQRVGPLGDKMELVRDAQGQLWTRCTCGHVLAPAAENWRTYAGYTVATLGEVGSALRVHESMEIRRYSCPGCGRIHAVDLCRQGAPDLHDIHLALRTDG